MNFLDLVRNRFSSRKYQDKQVEEEKIVQVLEAARMAPSAVNYQPWVFVVIREAENLEKIHACYHRDWFNQAPVVIVACADHAQSWKRSDGKDHADIDVAIAVDHITLAATEAGLATCWVCNFDPEKTRQTLALPDHIEPVAMIPLAYPADSPDTARHTQKRKTLNQIVRWESFQEEI